MYDRLAFNMCQDSISEWFWILKDGKLHGDIKETIKDYDETKLRLVRNAIKQNMDIEKIREIVKPHFNYEEMLEIYLGFNNGLNIEQVKVYAKSGFESNKMQYIRKAIENGADLNHVKEFARYEYDCMQMYEIMRALELRIPVEKIREFANPKIPAEEIRQHICKFEPKDKFQLSKRKESFDYFKAQILSMLNE